MPLDFFRDATNYAISPGVTGKALQWRSRAVIFPASQVVVNCRAGRRRDRRSHSDPPFRGRARRASKLTRNRARRHPGARQQHYPPTIAHPGLGFCQPTPAAPGAPVSSAQQPLPEWVRVQPVRGRGPAEADQGSLPASRMVRRNRPPLDPMPSTTANCCVIARMVGPSRWPIASPLSENRTVCGQSVITCDAARNPFSWFGARSIRRLTPARNSVVIGSTVA